MTLTEGGNGGKATVFVSISYLFQYDKICKEQNIICSFTHSRVHSHVIILVRVRRVGVFNFGSGRVGVLKKYFGSGRVGLGIGYLYQIPSQLGIMGY